MTRGVGASGSLGTAFESTYATYAAPTKFMNIRNESLAYDDAKIARRPLRGHADLVGFLPGNVHVNGTFEVEITEDLLAHLLFACRGGVVKSGTTPNFTYTYTPSQVAEITAPQESLSITVVKNGEAFGYTGCVIGQQTYTLADGLLIGTFAVVGSDEADQSVPTPVYPTTDPFGPGQYIIEVPTATQVYDTDMFTIDINDNATPEFRLRDDTRGATFIKFGERLVTATLQRDFEDRTEFDAFKASTAQSLTIVATKSATRRITWLIPAGIKRTYPVVGLSGQADLIRASIDYAGTYNAGTSKSVEIKVLTSEDIT